MAVAVTAAAMAAVSPASASVQEAPAAVAAGAFACGVAGYNLDHHPFAQHFLQNVNLRNGPAWGCQIVGTAAPVNSVDYYCTTDGFTYLRTASTKLGWVSNLYLDDGGSRIPC